MFAAAGLPLLRVPVKTGYAPQEIQTLLNPYLQSVAPATVKAAAPVTPSSLPTIAASAKVIVTASATSPACPKCGAVMLLRMAKTGSNAGGKFWGCPNFPRCRAVLPV